MAQETPKHAGGRPRKYQTPEQMQEAIDTYFDTDTEPTVTGLCLALGFASREALLNYQGYGTEFNDTIKRAKLRIEQRYERKLAEKGQHAAGPIFALKNFGWKDTQSVEITELPPIQMTFNSDGPTTIPTDAEPKTD